MEQPPSKQEIPKKAPSTPTQKPEPKKPSPPPAPKKPDPREQVAQNKTKEQMDNPKPADNGTVVVDKGKETPDETPPESPPPDAGNEEPNADNTVSPPLEDDEVKVTDDEGNELQESFGVRRNRFTPKVNRSYFPTTLEERNNLQLPSPVARLSYAGMNNYNDDFSDIDWDAYINLPDLVPDSNCFLI